MPVGSVAIFGFDPTYGQGSTGGAGQAQRARQPEQPRQQRAAAAARYREGQSSSRRSPAARSAFQQICMAPPEPLARQIAASVELSVKTPLTPFSGFERSIFIATPLPRAVSSITDTSSDGSATSTERVRSKPIPASATVAWEFTLRGNSGQTARVGPS